MLPRTIPHFTTAAIRCGRRQQCTAARSVAWVETTTVGASALCRRPNLRQLGGNPAAALFRARSLSTGNNNNNNNNSGSDNHHGVGRSPPGMSASGDARQAAAKGPESAAAGSLSSVNPPSPIDNAASAKSTGTPPSALEQPLQHSIPSSDSRSPPASLSTTPLTATNNNNAKESSSPVPPPAAPSVKSPIDPSQITSTEGNKSPISPPLTSAVETAQTPLGEASEATAAPPATGGAGSIVSEYYDKAHRLWSDRSGMSEILELKESVDAAGAAYDLASAEVISNRRNLDDSLRKWEVASGQHLQLLQRRESWTPEDAQRFADFVSLEITSRAELEQARHLLARSEELLTKAQLDYINKMRRRYHEEQIWQDQWRVLGTYGTWALICLNSCVFLGSQYFQRRRERERTETIAQLIRDSNNGNNALQAEGSQVPAVATDEASDAAPAPVVQTEDVAANKKEATDDSVHARDASTSEAPAKEVTGKGPYPRVTLATERIGNTVATIGAAVNKWEHRLRTDAKEFVVSTHQKLHKALPANIAGEMPQSVSDIDVPSAIIGASVGGITVLAASLLVSSLSGRRR